MSERKSPSKSATLYSVGTKKTGNDGNKWIVVSNKNNVKKWALFKKVTKKKSNKVSNNTISNNTISINKKDFPVLEIIRSYKNIYELIINKSLEYKIEITPQNSTVEQSNVTYFKKDSYKASSSSYFDTTMHIVGSLNGNTWTWNSFFKDVHKGIFLDNIAPYLSNNASYMTLSKLFNQPVITFPEKYRQTIPFLLSYLYDPSKGNIIRFSESNTSNDYWYIFIRMELDIPYWYQLRDNILPDLNNVVQNGGLSKNGGFKGTYRLLKDDPLAHINKNFKKLNIL